MARKKGGDYMCEVCGAEADLILEGFDTVKDVLKAGTMVCENCGAKEDVVLSDQEDSTIKAVKLAVEREKAAHLFYTDAAKKTGSERGRDMFTQLAAFELNHYKKMIHLYHSLQKSGQWVSYEGQEDVKPSRRIEDLRSQLDTKDDDIAALTLAISKEQEAESLYNQMAEKAEDPKGREMLKRLARDEELHRKILGDQLYALSNRGLWVWAE